MRSTLVKICLNDLLLLIGLYNIRKLSLEEFYMHKKIKKLVINSIKTLKEAELPEECLSKIKEAFVGIANNKITVSQSYCNIEYTLLKQMNQKYFFVVKNAFYELGILIQDTVEVSPLLVGECYAEDSKVQDVYLDEYLELTKKETCFLLAGELGIEPSELGI